MYQKEEIERKLRIDSVDGLPKEFIKLSNKLATKFLADIYIHDEDIFEVSEEMVRNRIRNLMKEQLLVNPEMTAKDFQATFVLKKIFFDLAAINFLVELASENNPMYFIYAIPFFCVKVKVTLVDVMRKNRFLPVDELEGILYKACDDTLQAYAKTGRAFLFSNLERFMKGEINQLVGSYQPFGLSRSQYEDYHKFMGIICSHPEFSSKDAAVIAEMMSTPKNPVSEKKVKELFCFMEINDSKNHISMQSDSYHDKYKDQEDKKGNTSFDLDEIIEKLNLKDWEILVVDYFYQNGSVKITAELEDLTGMSRHKIGKVRDRLVEELRHYVRIQESEPTKKDSEKKNRLEPIE